MPVKVTIRPNGPYLVEGEIELTDVDGNKVDTSARGLGSRCAGAGHCG